MRHGHDSMCINSNITQQLTAHCGSSRQGPRQTAAQCPALGPAGQKPVLGPAEHGPALGLAGSSPAVGPQLSVALKSTDFTGASCLEHALCLQLLFHPLLPETVKAINQHQMKGQTPTPLSSGSLT